MGSLTVSMTSQLSLHSLGDFLENDQSQKSAEPVRNIRSDRLKSMKEHKQEIRSQGSRKENIRMESKFPPIIGPPENETIEGNDKVSIDATSEVDL